MVLTVALILSTYFTVIDNYDGESHHSYFKLVTKLLSMKYKYNTYYKYSLQNQHYKIFLSAKIFIIKKGGQNARQHLIYNKLQN